VLTRGERQRRGHEERPEIREMEEIVQVRPQRGESTEERPGGEARQERAQKGAGGESSSACTPRQNDLPAKSQAKASRDLVWEAK